MAVTNASLFHQGGKIWANGYGSGSGVLENSCPGCKPAWNCDAARPKEFVLRNRQPVNRGRDSIHELREGQARRR
jgi:hypothetical protein